MCSQIMRDVCGSKLEVFFFNEYINRLPFIDSFKIHQLEIKCDNDGSWWSHYNLSSLSRFYSTKKNYSKLALKQSKKKKKKFEQ